MNGTPIDLDCVTSCCYHSYSYILCRIPWYVLPVQTVRLWWYRRFIVVRVLTAASFVTPSVSHSHRCLSLTLIFFFHHVCRLNQIIVYDQQLFSVDISIMYVSQEHLSSGILRVVISHFSPAVFQVPEFSRKTGNYLHCHIWGTQRVHFYYFVVTWQLVDKIWRKTTLIFFNTCQLGNEVL